MPVTPKTDYFWTDMAQAADRLHGTIVLYDNEPVYIQDIVESDDVKDRCPRARLFYCSDPKGTILRKTLNSPKFNKFRELPKLGFVNLKNGTLIYVSRRIRSTRSHGLNNENVGCSVVYFNDGRITFAGDRQSFSTSIWADPGFNNTHHGRFPALADLIQKLKPGAAAAFDRNYAVIRDPSGYRWLYRGPDAVGLFTDADTLMLTETTSYLRQEIMANPAFTINRIVEF